MNDIGSNNIGMMFIEGKLRYEYKKEQEAIRARKHTKSWKQVTMSRILRVSKAIGNLSKRKEAQPMTLEQNPVAEAS